MRKLNEERWFDYKKKVARKRAEKAMRQFA
jgi:hypothetical protein